MSANSATIIKKPKEKKKAEYTELLHFTNDLMNVPIIAGAISNKNTSCSI